MQKASLIVPIALVSSVLVFAAGQPDATAAKVGFNETGLPIVDEPFSFTMWVQTNVPHPEEQPFTAMIAETTNVYPEYVPIPADGMAERKAVMWASGDYPDVLGIQTVTRLDLDTYGPQGIIIPVNDLIDKYMTNLRRFTTERGMYNDVIATMTYPDGSIYGFPELRTNFHSVRGAPIINMTWLDTLGLDVPETPEQFLDAMRAFKNGDPNGNGKADEIPFVVMRLWEDVYISLGQMMGPFGYTYGYQIEDGKVIDPRLLPEYKDGIKFLRQLWTEGLMDPELFTQDTPTYRAKAQAQPPVYGFAVTWRQGYTFGEEVAQKNYVPIPPLMDENEVRRWWGLKQRTTVSESLVITSAAEDPIPQVVARWVDYLQSPGINEQANAGPEGIGVEFRDDGTYVKLDQVGRLPEGYNTMQEWFFEHHLFQKMPHLDPDANLYIDPATYTPGDPTEPGSREFGGPGFARGGNQEKMVHDDILGPYMVQEFPVSIKPTPAETEEVATIVPDLEKYLTETMARWIIGRIDVDADWADYLRRAERLGALRVLEIMQAQYDRFLAAKQ